MRKRKGLIFLITFLLVTGIITGGILAEESKDDGSGTGTVKFSLPSDFDSNEKKELESGDYKLVIGLVKIADIGWDGSKGQFTFTSELVSSSTISELEEAAADYTKNGKNDPTDGYYSSLMDVMSKVAIEAANNADFSKMDHENDFDLDDPADAEEGVYLVVPHNASATAVSDFIKTETDEDGKNTVTYSFANTTGWEHDFSMNLLIISDAQYALFDTKKVELKSTPVHRYGKIQIDKRLDNFVSDGIFVFKITVKDPDGNTIYSDVRSITMTAAGKMSIEDLPLFPVNSEVTVEEVYSGASYELVEGPEDPQTIEKAYVEGAKDAVIYHFAFENDYNNSNNHGHGIDNKFVKVNGSWDHVKGGEE